MDLTIHPCPMLLTDMILHQIAASKKRSSNDSGLQKKIWAMDIVENNKPSWCIEQAELRDSERVAFGFQFNPLRRHIVLTKSRSVGKTENYSSYKVTKASNHGI